MLMIYRAYRSLIYEPIYYHVQVNRDYLLSLIYFHIQHLCCSGEQT